MPDIKFRIVRSFGAGITPSTEKAYRVETVEPMSEQEAMQLLRDLGSPYTGQKYLPKKEKDNEH